MNWELFYIVGAAVLGAFSLTYLLGYLHDLVVKFKTVYRVAKYKGEVIHRVGDNVATGKIEVVIQAGTDLYVGGSISQISNVLVNGMARWTGSKWEPVIIPGPRFTVAQLTRLSNGNIVIQGTFIAKIGDSNAPTNG